MHTVWQGPGEGWSGEGCGILQVREGGHSPRHQGGHRICRQAPLYTPYWKEFRQKQLATAKRRISLKFNFNHGPPKYKMVMSV